MHTTTVEELIRHLQKFPPDAPVELSTYGCGTTSQYNYDVNRVQLKDGVVVIEAEDN
jgi:hypothetical protein